MVFFCQAKEMIVIHKLQSNQNLCILIKNFKKSKGGKIMAAVAGMGSFPNQNYDLRIEKIEGTYEEKKILIWKG